MTRDNAGFSLIEMLISVAIVAVLAMFFLRGFGISSLLNRKTTENYRAAVAAGNLMETYKATGIPGIDPSPSATPMAAPLVMTTMYPSGSGITDYDIELTVTVEPNATEAPYSTVNGIETVTPDSVNAYWCEAIDHDIGEFERGQLTLYDEDALVESEKYYVHDAEDVVVNGRVITALWVTDHVDLVFDYDVEYTYKYIDEETGEEMAAPDTEGVVRHTIVTSPNGTASDAALFLFVYPPKISVAELGVPFVDSVKNETSMPMAYAFPQPYALQDKATWQDNVQFYGFVNANSIKGLNPIENLLTTEQSMTMYKVTISLPNGTELASSYLDLRR